MHAVLVNDDMKCSKCIYTYTIYNYYTIYINTISVFPLQNSNCSFNPVCYCICCFSVISLFVKLTSNFWVKIISSKISSCKSYSKCFSVYVYNAIYLYLYNVSIFCTLKWLKIFFSQRTLTVLYCKHYFSKS